MKNRTIYILAIILIIISISGRMNAQAGYSPTSPIDMGTKSANFSYSDTKNTKDYASNSYIYNLNTGVVFYKFTLTKQMDITISHCGSALSRTYLRLLKSITLNDAVAVSNSSDQCSNKNQAYLKLEKLQPGTYYIVSQGGSSGSNGNITTSIQGTSRSLAEYYLGTITQSFSYSHYADTKTSLNKWGFRPSNDAFYLFYIIKPMKLRITNSMDSQSGSCITLANSSLTSSIDYKCFPANNPDNQYLDIDFLVPGSYCVISEGTMENGVINTGIEICDLLEFNLGAKELPFEYTHTQNTNEKYTGTTDGIFYRIDIRKKMDLIIKNTTAFTAGSCISVLNSSKTSTLATKCFPKNNPSDEALEVNGLEPGVYYIVSKGKSEEGFITTDIKGYILAEYDLGSKSAPFDYFHTQNTAKSRNEWNNKPTKDAMYQIKIEGQPKDLRISNAMSSSAGSCISLLNSSKTSAIATKCFSKNNLSNDYLEFKKLQTGVYYVVSEGQAENGDITTYISIFDDVLNRNKNYIKTRNYTSEDAVKYLDAIQYFDGLGRPVQNVQQGITPNGYDLVTYQEYDQYGRDSKAWLPSVMQNNNGDFALLPKVRTNAIVTYADSAFSHPVYEVSPLNRVLEQYGPGADWQNNKKSIKSEYLTNVESGDDNLICAYYYVSYPAAGGTYLRKNGNYKTNQLYVTKMTDEDQNVSYEFKNKSGQIVLTRQMNESERLDTYYTYDDPGNLYFVIPPIAADNLKADGIDWNEINNDFVKNLAYLYTYDNRNRCIKKKIPGTDWIHYVYDKADRLIFTQDGEQRKKTPAEWTYTIPDIYGRVVLTGTYKSGMVTTAAYGDIVVKATFDSTQVKTFCYKIDNLLLADTIRTLSVNYYDTYKYRKMLPKMFDTRLAYKADAAYGVRYGDDNSNYQHRGLMTGSITAQFDPTTTAVNYLYTNIYYDDKKRPIQSKSTNHLGGMEEEYIAYNFTGQPIKKQHIHTATGKTTQTEYYTYEYDHAGRLTKTRHQLKEGTAAPKPEVILADNTYDELGRLKTNKKSGQTNLETTYTYNIRSWTKSITSPLFKQTLYYNESYGGNKAQYNGNISAMDWNVWDETKKTWEKNRTYIFDYDNLSRLKAANYNEENEGTIKNKYTTSYAYDKHGNITTLTRNGQKSSSASDFGIVDQFTTMTYAGNQLKKIVDVGANVILPESNDFKDDTAGKGEYTYNANGAMDKDTHKGILGIKYNSLNLPQELTVKNKSTVGKIYYTYSATGAKLKVQYLASADLATNPVHGITDQDKLFEINETTDYVGHIIYEKGSLKRILIDGGYIEGGVYHFYLTDHLGNNRVVAKADGTVIQKNHYYPFGTPFAETAKAEQGKQPYKYNGKEYQQIHQLNLYDYAARQMDGIRFTRPDPHAENYYSWSPYVYCGNNPLKYIDPTGMDWVFRYSEGKYEAYYDRDVRSQKDVYKKYGSDTQTMHLGNGANIKFYNGKGEMTGEFTFMNDKKDNKYGTVTNGNGDQLVSNEITEGTNYRIFGTSDDSVDASTLYQNLFGSSYIGGNNPKTYKNEKGERSDSYQFKPIGEAEAAAYQHDLDYDRLGATGPTDAFFNRKTGQADRDLANRSKAVMNNPNLPKWDRNRGKAIYTLFNVIAKSKGK